MSIASLVAFNYTNFILSKRFGRRTKGLHYRSSISRTGILPQAPHIQRLILFPVITSSINNEDLSSFFLTRASLLASFCFADLASLAFEAYSF
jgi:hypothetical protein